MRRDREMVIMLLGIEIMWVQEGYDDWWYDDMMIWKADKIGIFPEFGNDLGRTWEDLSVL